MATWGGFTNGTKWLMPYMPRLLSVKVPSLTCARDEASIARRLRQALQLASKRSQPHFSAPCRTGTTSPCGDATATPMFTVS